MKILLLVAGGRGGSDFFQGINLIAISFVQYAEELCISIKVTTE